MRIINDSDQSILSRGDAVGAPWLWYDTLALDGTVSPWKDVPLGSMYWRISAGSVAVYFKSANTGATSDWAQVFATGQTITGNLNLNGGTLTAGDVVIAV